MIQFAHNTNTFSRLHYLPFFYQLEIFFDALYRIVNVILDSFILYASFEFYVYKKSFKFTVLNLNKMQGIRIVSIDP